MSILLSINVGMDNTSEAFRSFVHGYRILGSYQDAEGSNLDILEVTQRDSSIDRARTAQRNPGSRHLKQNGKDAALIAFLSPDQQDWRFSLVKLEYSLGVKMGNKDRGGIDPAKRLSFLIGRHEVIRFRAALLHFFRKLKNRFSKSLKKLSILKV